MTNERISNLLIHTPAACHSQVEKPRDTNSMGLTTRVTETQGLRHHCYLQTHQQEAASELEEPGIKMAGLYGMHVCLVAA